MLRRALEAGQKEDEPPLPPQFHLNDKRLLARAYDHCDKISARNSRSFHLASRFLPRRKRRALRALYAFCRRTDDLVDQPPALFTDSANLRAALADWRFRSLSPSPHPADPVLLAWTDARRRYRIPLRYAEQLLHEVGHDIECVRYTTFAELAAYCYGVAATVGLMSMHIIGSPRRRPSPTQ